jgi:hypothetical protein
MNREQVVGLLCGALLAGCVSAGVEECGPNRWRTSGTA